MTNWKELSRQLRMLMRRIIINPPSRVPGTGRSVLLAKAAPLAISYCGLRQNSTKTKLLAATKAQANWFSLGYRNSLAKVRARH